MSYMRFLEDKIYDIWNQRGTNIITKKNIELKKNTLTNQLVLRGHTKMIFNIRTYYRICGITEKMKCLKYLNLPT